MTRGEIIRLAESAGITVIGEAVWRLCELVAAAEREACAEVLVVKIKRHEQIAQECALRGEYDEVTGLRSTARKLSECVAEIRARGEK